MKKELIISISITVLLVAGVLFWNRQQTQPTPTTTNQTNTQTPSESITRAAVAKHNLTSDCWIIINNAAYDVTSYLTDHPGGSETIIPTCGTDATENYDAIKSGRGHSTAADMDLTSFLIGTIQ